MNIHYNMKPQGKMLEAFMDNRSYVSGLIGPLGSGKTWQVCQKLLVLMTEQEPEESGIRHSRVVAIRNSYKELTSTTVSEWQEKFNHISQYTQGNVTYPASRINFRLPDGTSVQSEIAYISADGTAREIESKFRGIQATFLWANELKELPKAAFDMALARIGRYPNNCSYHCAVFDTNAPDTDHWLYKIAEHEKPKSWNIFKQAGGVRRKSVNAQGLIEWEVNPEAENIANLPANYYENNLAGKRQDWIAVNLANEYGNVMDGKPVYPEYNDALHCSTANYIKELPLYIGVDFGLTPAAAFAQKTVNGQLRIIDELVSEDMGAKTFGELLKEMVSNKYYNATISGCGDPAGNARSQADESTAFDMLNLASGIKFTPANSNDPILRREAVALPLGRLVDGQPSFIIDPRCQVLRKGFQGGYCYERVKVKGDERFKDQPCKNKYSHVHDALQYLCLDMGLGKQLIKNIKRRPAKPTVAKPSNVFSFARNVNG